MNMNDASAQALQQLIADQRRILGVAPDNVRAILDTPDHRRAEAVAYAKQHEQEMEKALKWAQETLRHHAAGIPQGSPAIGAQSFWWGFHFWLNEPLLKKCYGGTDLLLALDGATGLAAAASVISAPVAPVAGALAVVLETGKAAVELADEGKGVYLSWTWPQLPALLAPEIAGPAALPLPTPIK